MKALIAELKRISDYNKWAKEAADALEAMEKDLADAHTQCADYINKCSEVAAKLIHVQAELAEERRKRDEAEASFAVCHSGSKRLVAKFEAAREVAIDLLWSDEVNHPTNVNWRKGSQPTETDKAATIDAEIAAKLKEVTK